MIVLLIVLGAVIGAAVMYLYQDLRSRIETGDRDLVLSLESMERYLSERVEALERAAVATDPPVDRKR